MKISSLTLHNFKRFKELQINFPLAEDGQPVSRLLIEGEAGIGKTSVLQAIALCLSLAAGRTRGVDSFEWKGWVPGRFERWGRPLVEMVVHFDAAEIAATQEAFSRWQSANRHHMGEREFVAPGDSPVVRLRLEGQRCWADSPAEYFQFRGRHYARQLLKSDPSARDLFDRLPGVFWYDHYRNLANQPTDPRAETSHYHHVGVVRLRDHLNSWQIKRLAKGAPNQDFLMHLENLYKQMFPGHSFGLPEPMYQSRDPSAEDFWFILSDGRLTYDIEEMSAAEQSIFPMLYEFVRLQIQNSVVLIDEVDMNLSPAMTERFVGLLPGMLPRCQILMSAHGEVVPRLLPERERLAL
jgi:hypothetical protein